MASPAVDWSEVRAVILHSDDWGLPAWTPAASEAPAVDGVTARFSASTLETAGDVERLARILHGHRGRDGQPAILQANYILLAPDFALLAERGDVRLTRFPEYGPRWERPGLGDALHAAIEEGVWRPEHHGALHYDLVRLRARVAAGETTAVLATRAGRWEVEDPHSHVEYLMPRAALRPLIREGVEAFRAVFGRQPVSTAPPGYAFTPWAIRQLRAQGLEIIQAPSRRSNLPAPARIAIRVARRYRSTVRRLRSGLWTVERNADFEPVGYGSSPDRVGERVFATWNKREPAVVSTHRVNFCGWDRDAVERGVAALDRLLGLISDGVFITDSEAVQLAASGTSVARRGRAVVFRNYSTRRRTIEVNPQLLADMGIARGRPTAVKVPPGEKVVGALELGTPVAPGLR